MEKPRSGRADQGRPGVVGPAGRVRDGNGPAGRYTLSSSLLGERRT